MDFTQDRLDDVGACGPAGSLADAGIAWPQPLEQEGLRGEIRGYVMESLGYKDGVRVVDDTGFLKKESHSVGVARQYSGTAGRIENCQLGLFPGYAGRYGQALIDCRLYPPKAWADAAYGSDHGLRRMLEERDQAHVLAARGNHHLQFIGQGGIVAANPAELVEEFANADWTALATGEGSKGPRLYDRACPVIPWRRREGWEHLLLVRRSRRDPQKLAYDLVFCPDRTILAELAGAAGLRWTIAACFQRARDDLGLDHCEARSWPGWRRN